MVDFDRSVVGNQFPAVLNRTLNEQFSRRSTPPLTKLAGTTDLNFAFTSRSEDISDTASLDYTVGGGAVTRFTAVESGPDGNDITITINDAAASVSVTGTDIVVNVDITGGATVQDVIDAVNGDGSASALVTAELISGSGTDAAETLATTNLSGGTDTGIIDLDLESLEVKLRTTNRPTSTEEITITLPGPASSTVTTTVSDAIDALKAGSLSDLVSDGFDFSFSGTAKEGMWTITIPGDATDNFTSPSPSGTGVYLPGGEVLVLAQAKSTDGTDFYYWGDNDGVFDVIRYMKFYTPERADLDDDGDLSDVVTVGTGSDGLAYSLDFGKLSQSELETVIDTVNTNITTTVVRDTAGNDTTIVAVANALRPAGLQPGGSAATTLDEALTLEPRLVGDIPTIATVGDRGVRLQLPVVDGAPTDTGLEGEMRYDGTGTAIYVFSGGAWASISLS